LALLSDGVEIGPVKISTTAQIIQIGENNISSRRATTQFLRNVFIAPRIINIERTSMVTNATIPNSWSPIFEIPYSVFED